MNDPIAYVSDFSEPADWIDAATMLALPGDSPRALVGPVPVHDGLRDLANAAGCSVAIVERIEALEPTHWTVVASGYAEGLPGSGTFDRDCIRRWTSRIFVVGGIANFCNIGIFPIHPRLSDLHPERFGPGEDPRWLDASAWNTLLASGEGIIWLPRDICLWRYDATGMLPLVENSLARWLLEHAGPNGSSLSDIVLMSSTPAFCLAEMPDPMPWLRLFRTELLTIRNNSERQRIVSRDQQPPNAYAVVAIDGTALSKTLTHRLRSVRPGADS